MPHSRIISIIGLGYVGLTLVAAFSRVGKVIAFDIDAKRVAELTKGFDRNDEIDPDQLILGNIQFTTELTDLAVSDFYIISVDTPVDEDNHPVIQPLLEATKSVGSILKKGDIVVYESSVYPGATEEYCLPLLAQTSNLFAKVDFSIGYSPERINPGDKEHTFENITKIISALDDQTLDIMADVYTSVIKEVYRAPSMRVAEAAKIIENTQRDINIAFMNDIAIMMHAFNIDTRQVLSAMKTKWNYLPFRPGLVGGHCISVNPYYLMEKAETVGHQSDLIMAGRKVNEYLTEFISDQAIKEMLKLNIPIKNARVAVLGLTYKENCSDARDTQVINIIEHLKGYGVDILVHDPIASPQQVKKEYNIELVDWKALKDLDVMIFCVAHKQYLRLPIEDYKSKLKSIGLIMDVKELFNQKDFEDTGITIWRL